MLPLPSAYRRVRTGMPGPFREVPEVKPDEHVEQEATRGSWHRY